MKIPQIFFGTYIILILFALGCTTAPVARDQTKTQGQWETKALVKDFKRQKNSSLSIDFAAIKQEKLRAEVTGPFGVSVATLVINKDQIQIAMHTQKRFYSGKITEKAMTTALGIPLDPRVLYFVLFDEDLPAKSFDCINDEASLPQECHGRNMDLKVRWTERQGEMKRISISKTDFEVLILVKSFTTKVQESADLFKINPPEAYTSYQLD